MLFYILKVKPYTIMQDNYIELFNELTILTVYTMLTPFIHESEGFNGEIKYEHGFAVASIIFFNVLVNFLLFAKSTFS
jgi:hypothetical protein